MRMTKCLQINILYGWSREQRNILRKYHKMLSRVLSPFLGCRTYSARLSVRSISDNITIRDVDLSNFPTEKIRNFSIVAHLIQAFVSENNFDPQMMSKLGSSLSGQTFILLRGQILMLPNPPQRKLIILTTSLDARGFKSNKNFSSQQIQV